jgi:hypothetical protein
MLLVVPVQHLPVLPRAPYGHSCHLWSQLLPDMRNASLLSGLTGLFLPLPGGQDLLFLCGRGI